MVFVFTAVIAFFTFLFWNIERWNRVSAQDGLQNAKS